MSLAWRVEQHTMFPWSLMRVWRGGEMNLLYLTRCCPTSNAFSKLMVRTLCSSQVMETSSRNSPAARQQNKKNGHTSAFSFGVICKLLSCLKSLVVSLRAKYPIQKCWEGLVITHEVQPDAHTTTDIFQAQSVKPGKSSLDERSTKSPHTA